MNVLCARVVSVGPKKYHDVSMVSKYTEGKKIFKCYMDFGNIKQSVLGLLLTLTLTLHNFHTLKSVS